MTMYISTLVKIRWLRLICIPFYVMLYLLLSHFYNPVPFCTHICAPPSSSSFMAYDWSRLDLKQGCRNTSFKCQIILNAKLGGSIRFHFIRQIRQRRGGNSKVQGKENPTHFPTTSPPFYIINKGCLGRRHLISVWSDHVRLRHPVLTPSTGSIQNETREEGGRRRRRRMTYFSPLAKK